MQTDQYIAELSYFGHTWLLNSFVYIRMCVGASHYRGNSRQSFCFGDVSADKVSVERSPPIGRDILRDTKLQEFCKNNFCSVVLLIAAATAYITNVNSCCCHAWSFLSSSSLMNSSSSFVTGAGLTKHVKHDRGCRSDLTHVRWWHGRVCVPERSSSR